MNDLELQQKLWRLHANYVLGLLFVVSVISILDRYIISILLEPIKQELAVSDTAMGFLTGLAFAFFNAVAAIPLARLSDRYSRRTIIAVGLAAWSVLTALQGIAKSFSVLAIARIGVGVGEATTAPAAHSLISDYFPPERRATAISIFTTGGHVGLMLGLAAGGLLYESLGWRMTLISVGLPGLLLAMVVALTVREPERGSNGQVPSLATVIESKSTPQESIISVLRYLWSKKTYRHIAIVLPLFVFTNYATNIWGAAFLIRVHGWGIAQVGVGLGLTVGISGMLGNIIGANLCDRLGARDERWHLWLPTMAAILMLPLYVCFLFWQDPMMSLMFLGGAIFLISFHISPIYALAQSLSHPRNRATASAQLHLMSAVFAAGLGPFIVGILNDFLLPQWGDIAVRYSLLVIIPAILWGSVHALVAAGSVRDDLAATKSEQL
jgi:predicted MFS family arabinose efflux permease